MKKLIAIILSMSLALSLVGFCFAEGEEPPVTEEIIEEYSNILGASTSLTISSSGTASITVECLGYSGTTHITTKTYLERWTGSGWSRVSINGASQIEDGTSGSSFSHVYTTTVGSGTYRATAVFTVTRGTVETVTIRSNQVTH